MVHRSVGIAARALFALVKPAAIFAAIQIDPDGGLLLSQVFLVGLVFMALTGTNAHRAYYQAYFNPGTGAVRLARGRLYKDYLDHIGLQVLPVVLGFVLVGAVWPGMAPIALWMGLIFGLAEKISDEGIRHSQFSLNNLHLIGWALTKVLACWLAILVSWLGWSAIGRGFPVLLLVAMVVFGGAGVHKAIRQIAFALALAPLGALCRAVGLIRRDCAQIAWVFAGIAFLSMDKWVVQALQPDALPRYMFAAQMASLFLVLQSMFILAPSRVKLLRQNPGHIPALRYGSKAIAAAAAVTGVGVWHWAEGVHAEALVYVPFFLISVFVLMAPYLDRFYWVTQDWLRIAADAALGIGFVVGAGLLYWLGSDLLVILAFLGGILLLRLGVISVLVYHLGQQKN